MSALIGARVPFLDVEGEHGVGGGHGGEPDVVHGDGDHLPGDQEYLLSSGIVMGCENYP